MTNGPHPWAANLDTLRAQVWTVLVRGVHDRRAPARHPTLATIGRDALPKARTVVLRRMDRVSGCLDIHTDLQSAKVSELRAVPYAALHVWDTSAHLQIRLESEAAILSGADVTEIWARLPEPARQAYGRSPAPGQPIGGAIDYSCCPDVAAFAVLRLKAMAIDVLHLGTDHRRARYERGDAWKGHWLVP